MQKFMEYLTYIWNYKVSLVPVLVTYLLFDLQAIYRRATKRHYVPIYFLVFPHAYTDKLYAQYFNEDYFESNGINMSRQEKEVLRKKLISSAIISMIFAAIVAPYACGIIAAFYLSHQQFIEFMVFLLTVKSIFITAALYRLRKESAALDRGWPFFAVFSIYVLYIYFVARGLWKSFSWASSSLQDHGTAGLLLEMGDIFHEEFFINIIAVSLLTWFAQQRMTKPENVLPASNP